MPGMAHFLNKQLYVGTYHQVDFIEIYSMLERST